MKKILRIFQKNIIFFWSKNHLKSNSEIKNYIKKVRNKTMAIIFLEMRKLGAFENRLIILI